MHRPTDENSTARPAAQFWLLARHVLAWSKQPVVECPYTERAAAAERPSAAYAPAQITSVNRPKQHCRRAKQCKRQAWTIAR
jgi:hypothetical protein